MEAISEAVNAAKGFTAESPGNGAKVPSFFGKLNKTSGAAAFN